MPTRYKAIKVNGVKYDEHRWLMEQHLGRKLETWESVHHKDENPRNNDIDNLEIMSKSEHSKMHAIGRKMSEEAKRKISEFNKDKTCDYSRKLTNEDIDFIRSNYIPRDREFGTRGLGRRFGVNHETIRDIIAGNTYKFPI